MVRESGNFGLKDIWNEGETLGFVSRGGMAFQILQQALRGFKMAPLMSFLSVMTISVTLFLLGVFLLALENLDNYLYKARSDIGLSIFLEDTISVVERNALVDALREFSEVLEIQHLTKSEALKRFRLEVGKDSSFLDGLEQSNPLPASLEVQFAAGDVQASIYRQLADSFSERAGVESVEFNTGLVGQLAILSQMFYWVSWVSVVIMLLVTGFVVTNTIRLVLHARRDELAIMRLVGATSVFVRTPGMIEGGIQGGVGALLSVFGLIVFYKLVLKAFETFSLLNAVAKEFIFLSPWTLLLLLFSGVFVGVGGGYLAVRRFKDV